MISDTTSTPGFIEDEPDWTKPIVLVRKWSTSITPNREGGTKRRRRRENPRFQISYRREGYSPREIALYRANALGQLQSAVVVPVWVLKATASSFGTNSVTLSASASNAFKLGSWVYVVQGSNKCFRKITTISGAVITLSSVSTDKFPLGFDWSVFSAGDVYPCILGTRVDESFSVASRRHDIHGAEISVDEL